MNKNCFIKILLLLVFISFTYSADTLKVSYLKSNPIIDGNPDDFIKEMTPINFSTVQTTDSLIRQPSSKYYLSYNLQYLYLLIEIESDTVIFRDRAYQNGDGFHLVMAKPDYRKDETDEFYVLRFSPGSKNKQSDCRVWYYNKDLKANYLPNTKLVTKSINGKTFFELLLPWKDIYPYNPLWKSGIGFNLCFVKADGTKNKVFYYALYDKKIQWEQSPRKYIPLFFMTPNEISYDDHLLNIEKGNIKEGAKLYCSYYVYSSSVKNENFGINIKTADNNIKRLIREPLKIKKGFNQFSFQLNTSELPEDGYLMEWWTGNNPSEFLPLSVLPQVNLNILKTELMNKNNRISSGSRNTVMFRLNEIAVAEKSLKVYETAGELREKIKTTTRDIERLLTGDDFYKQKKGFFRRAYYEKGDSTFQPYSVKIPDNYDSAKKYPLVIFLHGSGQDDRGMLENANLGLKEFIEAAPNGRGVSNCYSTEESQKNIDETINDVVSNYNIDESKIILCGFSMGGYGVFRTFYEHPERYKALVIFSGHPSLANKWLGGSHPDFTQTEFAAKFKGKDIFIYHDSADLNCPIDLMKTAADNLSSAGARIKMVISEGQGHSILNDTNKIQFYDWLNKIK